MNGCIHNIKSERGTNESWYKPKYLNDRFKKWGEIVKKSENESSIAKLPSVKIRSSVIFETPLNI